MASTVLLVYITGIPHEYIKDWAYLLWTSSKSDKTFIDYYSMRISYEYLPTFSHKFHQKLIWSSYELIVLDENTREVQMW